MRTASSRRALAGDAPSSQRHPLLLPRTMTRLDRCYPRHQERRNGHRSAHIRSSQSALHSALAATAGFMSHLLLPARAAPASLPMISTTARNCHQILPRKRRTRKRFARTKQVWLRCAYSSGHIYQAHLRNPTLTRRASSEEEHLARGTTALVHGDGSCVQYLAA
jgi:hypothetical protein